MQYQCTECDKVHSTFAAAARCHHGIGGVTEIKCSGGEEAHEAHLHMNGECPWCGAYEPERATGEMPSDAR
jgi:hypothetical protein